MSVIARPGFYFNRRIRYAPQGRCTMCLQPAPVVEAYYVNVQRTETGKRPIERHEERALAGFCSDCFAWLAACWPVEV